MYVTDILIPSLQARSTEDAFCGAAVVLYSRKIDNSTKEKLGDLSEASRDEGESAESFLSICVGETVIITRDSRFDDLLEEFSRN